MTTFNDREKAFEDKYKHDQELQFKVEVRRNKLLGLWVAEMLVEGAHVIFRSACGAPPVFLSVW